MQGRRRRNYDSLSRRMYPHPEGGAGISKALPSAPRNTRGARSANSRQPRPAVMTSEPRGSYCLKGQPKLWFGWDGGRLESMIDTSAWTPWIPLENSWRGATLPAIGGLYRIRRIGDESLDYLGQTGTGTMTLRKRLAMLRGIYASVMPYCDPHVAAPGLWALVWLHRIPLEVSVMPMPGAGVLERKARESLEVSLHRQEFGHSPTINFGRMPPGFTRSSHNNARLQKVGKVFRGGPSQVELVGYHSPGIAPIGALEGECHGIAWCGHLWSPWVTPTKEALSSLGEQAGLYRLKRATSDELIYLGQGVVKRRLEAHLAKGITPKHSQSLMFRNPESIQVSWALNAGWMDHHRLELENDLIAAHVISIGCPPTAQFLG